MQVPQRDSDSARAKLVLDILENDTKANFQDNNLATYFQKNQGRGMAPFPPRSSRDLHCQQKNDQKYDN